jgi:hypothetical protein
MKSSILLQGLKELVYEDFQAFAQSHAPSPHVHSESGQRLTRSVQLTCVDRVMNAETTGHTDTETVKKYFL